MRTTLLFVAVLTAGCGGGPKLVPARGKALFAGQPLTAGGLWLVPEAGNDYAGERPSSRLELDGSFAFASYPHGNGAPPGAYKVILTQSLADRIKLPDCGKPDKTPLRLTVPPSGVTDAVIEVK